MRDPTFAYDVYEIYIYVYVYIEIRSYLFYTIVLRSQNICLLTLPVSGSAFLGSRLGGFAKGIS